MEQHIKKGSFRVPSVPLLLMTLLVGCAGPPTHEGTEWTQVPITDVHMVTGDWVGSVKKQAALLAEGSVRLIILENSTYVFAGQTTSRAAAGAGPLKVRDGRLIGDTDRRAMSISLYDHKGQPILAVEATNHETGDHFRGDFTKLP
jgi:hypothetical protein